MAAGLSCFCLDGPGILKCLVGWCIYSVEKKAFFIITQLLTQKILEIYQAKRYISN